jgi:hypothetical protein
MMSCAASTAWGHHVLLYYHTVRGMVVPCPFTPPRCKWSAVWHHPVRLPHHFSLAYEWSIGPMLQCVHMFAHLAGFNGATCLHILQWLSGEGAFVMCKHALGTRKPSCMPRPTKPFFIPEARGPQRAVGHMVAPEPSQVGRRSPKPRGTWQCRSPSSREGRQGTEPWGTWQGQTPLEQGGGVQSYGTRGSAGALPSREVRSRAVGHMVESEPS